jgi:hypothetical protein
VKTSDIFKMLALCAWKEKSLLENKRSSLMKGHTYESVNKCILGGLFIFGIKRFQQGIEANVNHGTEFCHKTCSKRNTCA